MKQLLCGSLAALLISMPIFAQTATGPDSSAGASAQEAGSMDASRDTTTPDSSTTIEDEQRMEETTPSTDMSSPEATQEPLPDTTPSDEVEMQEDTSVPSTTTPSAMEESETQSE